MPMRFRSDGPFARIFLRLQDNHLTRKMDDQRVIGIALRSGQLLNLSALARTVDSCLMNCLVQVTQRVVRP